MIIQKMNSSTKLRQCGENNSLKKSEESKENEFEKQNKFSTSNLNWVPDVVPKDKDHNKGQSGY